MLGLPGQARAAQPEGVDSGEVGDPTSGGGELGADASLGAEADAGATADSDTSWDSSADTSADTSAAAEPPAETTAAPAGGEVVADTGTGIDPMKGRFAIGAIRTIAGVNGINFRYFVADKLSIGASVGVALFTYKENDPMSTDPCPGDSCTFENTRTVAAMGYNVEVLYWAKQGREAGNLPFRADFGVGGRVGLLSIVNTQDVADNLDDPTELHVELPIVMQLMFGNNFSLAPELGMDFRIVPGSRERGDSNQGTGYPATISFDPNSVGPGFGWEITPGIGLFAGASMHYIF